MEIWTLYWEIIISSGNILTIDARVAPAPTPTKIAGNAQQINVDNDAMRVIILTLVDSFSGIKIYNSIIITTFVAVWPLSRKIFFISSVLIFLSDLYAMSTFPALKSTSTFLTNLSW